VLYLLYWYGAISLVTSVFFFIDKRLAESRSRRIPEKWLHTLELAGGWPGALISSELFRHKRQKSSYMYILYAIVALHVFIWLALMLMKNK